ncbi:MAG: inositol monophosphatase family protein [Ignavibacteriales bacterium]|nr:inositol monophosphatase family protein [Ignavibacteriales bacterium]
MIDNVIKISKEAGEIIKQAFRTNFSVEYKTNESNLVTEIDKKSEKLIIDFIKKKYPSHGILAEETGGDYLNKEFVWVIDPLDGTTNFAHGLPIFSVSIGVQKNGKSICGVVYDIMRGVLYSTEFGSGSFCNGRRMKVSENENLSHSVLVTGFPYDIAENPGNAIDIFATFIKKSRAIRRLGSAAIDFCYVADGVFDGFWEVNLNPWDICAGRLIVEEAGGLVSDFAGNEKDIFCKQILATNGKVSKRMLQELSNFT